MSSAMIFDDCNVDENCMDVPVYFTRNETLRDRLMKGILLLSKIARPGPVFHGRF